MEMFSAIVYAFYAYKISAWVYDDGVISAVVPICVYFWVGFMGLVVEAHP